jgi:Zn-dependent protease with chaperone function
MRNTSRNLVIIFCFLLLGISISTALAQGRDSDFEQEVIDRLEAINPEAVPVFQQATQAYDTSDYVTAKIGFEQVLELAPDFPDALRRLSYTELQLGQYENALTHAQKAYDLNPSTYNKTALARSLNATEKPENTARALTLAKEAVQEIPDDPAALNELMVAAFLQEDFETLGTSSKTLIRLLPEFPLPHFFYAMVMAEDGKWERAEQELIKAGELGMPADDIDKLLVETGIAQQAMLYRSARRSSYVVAGWLIGLGILFLAGLILSKATLSAVRKSQSQANTTPSRNELSIRSIYRVVIFLTSTYFYISIPLIIFVLLIVAAGIIYYFYTQGLTFNRGVIFIIITILYTLYAVIRGIFYRSRQQDPGRELEPGEAPALWKLTREVADKLQTSPIQAIFLTPGTELAVYEKGGMLQKSRGKGVRSLVLGLGVLSGMTQGQLKAILAHEYGHFTGKDTAGGDLALRVQNSILMIAIRMINSGQARWYNPVWWFIRGFYNLFQRITLGASRLQEILADRSAAVHYGAHAFNEGLRHIIRQAITFQMQINGEINLALQNGTSLQNLYTLPMLSSTQQLENTYQETYNKPTGPFDSHPSPAERCQLVEQLNLAMIFTRVDDERPAWELFPDLEKFQKEMTDQVQKNLNEQKKNL